MGKISFEEAKEKNMILNSNEIVIFPKNVSLFPWPNVFYWANHPNKRGLGWHDSRISYPNNEIKIKNNLYVIDTHIAKDEEAQELVYKDSSLNKKTQKEIAEYLSEKEPKAHYMTTGHGREIYTPSFGPFIMSISPTHYLHFPGNKKSLAEDFSYQLHHSMIMDSESEEESSIEKKIKEFLY